MLSRSFFLRWLTIEILLIIYLNFECVTSLSHYPNNFELFSMTEFFFISGSISIRSHGVRVGTSICAADLGPYVNACSSVRRLILPRAYCCFTCDILDLRGVNTGEVKYYHYKTILRFLHRLFPKGKVNLQKK